MPVPRISVVVPLYNKAKHIGATIASVLVQRYAEFELVVVDDGSSDGGSQVVSAIGDPRLRLVRQENAGVSVARNRGVEESRGDYIAFLDADDEWMPWHLEELVGLIDEFPGTGIYSVAHEIVQGDTVYYPGTGVVEGFRGRVDDVAGTFSRGLALVNSSTACVSRDAFVRSGGFPVGVKRGEDVYLWLKIGMTEGLVHSARVCARYNRDATNRSNVSGSHEVPYYMQWLDGLVEQDMAPSHEVPGICALLKKGIIFSAAGCRVDGDLSAIAAMRRLYVVRTNALLKVLLALMPLVPRSVLLFARRYRHRQA